MRRSLVNSESKYKSVVIIGVDGAGAFFDKTDTPNFDEIFDKGCITYQMKSAFPTSTAENFGSMFYGIEPQYHNLNNLYATHRHYSSDVFHSFFWYAHEMFPNKKAVSIAGWSPINTGIIDLEEGIYKYPNVDEDLTCESVADEFKKIIVENNDEYNLIFLHIDDVDSAGHEFGWKSKEFFEAIKKADCFIGEIYNTISQELEIDDVLFLVVSDHGGTVEGRHGGNSEEEVNAMFAACGKDVIEKGNIQEMETCDVAAVVLEALGVEIPKHFNGRVPVGIWKEKGEKDRVSIVGDGYVNPCRNYNMIYSPFESYEGKLKNKVLYYQGFDSEKKKGIYGQCLDGAFNYFDTPIELKSNMTSISISFWTQMREFSGDPVIISNKNWNSGRNPGFAIVQEKGLSTPYKIKVNIGDGNNRVNFDYPVPINYSNGWINYIFSIDFKNRKVKGYCDFNEMYSEDIPKEFNVESFFNAGKVIIGQDITHEYPVVLNADIDDVIIFNNLLTADEVNELEKVYSANIVDK